MTFASADDAHTEAIKLKSLMMDPTDVATLRSVMDQVLEEVRLKRTAGTMDWYEVQFRAISKIIPDGTYLDQVTTAMVERFIAKRLAQVSSNTVVHHLRALHRLFSYAIKMDLIEGNPLGRVDYPTVLQVKMDYFEPDEVPGMIAKVREDSISDADFLSVLAYTGIRRGEFLRLRCKDVDLKGKQLWIKGKSGNRSLPINPTVVSSLKRMLQCANGTGLMIPGGDTEFRYVMRRIKMVIDDPRMHAHALRHTFITGLVRAGIPLHVVKQLSGHRTLEMLMRYYHQGKEARDAIAKLPY